MIENNNKLRFKRISKYGKKEVFSSREDAKNCLEDYKFSEGQYSLYGEPIVMRYFDENGELQVLLAIGSSGETDTELASYHYIDSAKLDEDIKAVSAYVETKVDDIYNLVKSQKLIGHDSNTVKLDVNETESGTDITARVNIAEENHHKDNILIEQEDGLFVYADLSYSGNSDNEVISFTYSDKTDGIKTKNLLLPKETHVVDGKYDPSVEKIVLTLNTGEVINIDVDDLIGEWGVLPENATESPIILTKEPVKDYELIHGFAKWQDILKADVRIASNGQVPDNILKKDETGRYLYVEGKASNISYWKDGEKISVQKALDSLGLEISTSEGNIIYKRPDGVYATTVLDYNPTTNTLTFTTSNSDGEKVSSSFKLNSAQIFDDVSYDPVKESIRIRYKNQDGQYQTLDIPAKDIIEEWVVSNENHSVELVKNRSVDGKDVLTADVKISTLENNILEVQHHELYVRGEADNIKYGDSNVQSALETLEHDRTSAATSIDEIQKTLSNHSDRITTLETGLADETSSREAKDEELEGFINSVSADSVINVADTESIHLEKEKNTTIGKTGYVVKGNVKTSEDENNLIEVKEDGLLATVDLSYDSGTSIVKFTTNKGSKEFKLIDKSVISGIDYDTKTEEIVIKYVINDENRETRVPMRELIEEWEPDNTYNTVTLERTSVVDGKDKLTANVNILSGDDNLIKKVDTEEEGSHKYYLYVSHKAITDEIDTAKSGAIDESKKYTDDKGNEITTATDEKINSLSSTTKDLVETTSTKTLEDAKSYTDAKVKEESDAREAKDNELVQNITTLSDTIGTGFTTGEASNITVKFEKEIKDRQDADKGINDKFDAKLEKEASDRKDADNKINEKVDANKGIIGAIIKSNGFNTDGTYNKDTNAGTTYLKTIDSVAKANIALDNAIKAEVERATTEESNLDKKIDNETSRAQKAEAQIQNNIDNIKYTGISGNSVNVTVDNASKTIEAKVVIAASGTGDKQNIIISPEDKKGIYANVDLQYSNITNKLEFYINGVKTREYKFNMGSLLDEINFVRDMDLGTVKMVINYHTAAGDPASTEVDVSQLFDNWKVESGNHYGAIELTKTWNENDGKFVLSGGTVISELNDNILVNDKGALYVSGSGITKNNELIKELSGNTKGLQEEIDRVEVASGFDGDGNYVSNNNAHYIKNATSLTDADDALDAAIKEVSGKTDTSGEKADNLQKELDATQEATFGRNTSEADKYADIANNEEYPIIKDAKNMVDADHKLSRAVEKISGDVENLSATTSSLTDSLKNELDATQISTFGRNTSETDKYADIANNGAYPIIKDATDMVDADHKLAKAVETISGDVKNISAITSSMTESLQAELDATQKAAFGINSTSADTYAGMAHNDGTSYIKTAGNLFESDKLLDAAIKEVSGKTDDSTGKTESLQKELDVAENMVFGFDTNGDSKYSNIDNSKYAYLSGATVTSMLSADRALNDAIKGVSDKFDNLIAGSGVTHSAIISGTSDNKLEVNVKLSHAHKQENDDIENVEFANEFDIRNANLLKIIHVANSVKDSKNNGLYFDGSIDYGTFPASDD